MQLVSQVGQWVKRDDGWTIKEDRIKVSIQLLRHIMTQQTLRNTHIPMMRKYYGQDLIVLITWEKKDSWGKGSRMLRMC